MHQGSGRRYRLPYCMLVFVLCQSVLHDEWYKRWGRLPVAGRLSAPAQ